MESLTLGEIRRWCEVNGVSFVDAVKVLDFAFGCPDGCLGG